MKFGFFDDIRKEYVITQPDSPLPWINYLGSEDFFGLISNTAGGYAFYRDARLRRITRYRYNNVPIDTGGRMIYIRDHLTQEFWSPNWQPVRKPLKNFSCRHGLGYTTIESEYNGLKSWTRYFVPLRANLEVWQLRITNLESKPRQLSVFACVEFCLWDALDDATNFQRNFNTGEVEIEDGVIYHKTEYRERRNHFSFFTCSPPPAAVDTDRSSFLGQYRGWDLPEAVEKGQLNNSQSHGWAPVGALQVNITLQAGETRQVIFLLGYHENPNETKFDPQDSQRINKKTVRPIIDHYLHDYRIEQAFRNLGEYWSELLGKFQVKSPNAHTNRMVNVWNAYQCMITFNMSRSASYFESGIGRGMGFRDSNQDLLGFVHMVPQRARQRLLDLAATQLADGGAFHQYQPLTKRGNHDIGSNFNDDPLWLVVAVSAYLKETGDFSILDENVPYENDPALAKPLYEHMQRGLDYILNRLGPNGLPLMGRADWNDCLNLNCFSETPGQSFQTTTNMEGTTAESVFIAGLFIYAAKEFVQVADHLGKREDASRYHHAAVQMTQTILDHGWDGGWFRRAYDAFGRPIGSKENLEGQLYIEPQGMCVMAGVGLEDGKARTALDSVSEFLATPHGIVLLQPPYSRYYLHLGEISSYPPGYKENAGIFCHTNPWIMIAETRLGNGDKAFDYYIRINPSAREEISDLHRCEPYVYAQMIAGKDAPTHGEAKNSWLTGTAAWNFTAITQWILGIRPTLDGLMVDPVIPSDWDGFTVERWFRDVHYYIQVERTDEDALKGLWVNDSQIAGKTIPLPEPGTREIKVKCLL